MTKEQNDKVVELIGDDINHAYCYEEDGIYGLSICIGEVAPIDDETGCVEEDDIIYDFWDSVMDYCDENNIQYDYDTCEGSIYVRIE